MFTSYDFKSDSESSAVILLQTAIFLSGLKARIRIHSQVDLKFPIIDFVSSNEQGLSLPLKIPI